MNNSINTKPEQLVRDVFCCAAVIAFGLILALPRYCNNIDLGDEGFLAYSAVRVMDGQMPNRDFVSLQPPLSFYTVAAAFKIFGTSLVILRILGVCIYLISILLVYGITKHLTDRILALMAAVLAATIGMPFFNFTPFAVWHGIAASLLTVFFIIKFATANKRLWAFLAGLATVLTILSRHDQGVYLVIAVLIYFLIARIAINKKTNVPNLLGFWAIGIAVIIVPLTIYWIITGALPYMFQQLVVFPITTYAKTGSAPFPSFQASLPLYVNISMGLLYLPPLIEVVMAIWLASLALRRRFKTEHAVIMFVLIISILFYCQVLTRSDIFHMLITLPPFFILLSLAVHALSSAFNKPWFSAGVKIVMAFIAASFLLYTKPVFLPSPGNDLKTISLERSRVKTDAAVADSIENIVGMIQKYSGPDDSILCLPYQPMYYFLSERRNPTRWNYIWAGDQTAEDFNQLIEQARAAHPAVVVLFKRERMFRFATPIVDYVNRDYKLLRDDGSAAIYIPIDRTK
jgi:hypothetical protein